MAHEFHSFYYDQLKKEPVTDDFIIERDTPMTMELLRELIDEHRQNHVPRYEYLKAVYDAHYKIFGRDPRPDYKPDNRLAADMAYNITQTFEGYFIGKPIDLKTDNEAIAKYLDEYMRRNEQEDVDAELSELASKFGHSYEMFYQDEDGKPRSAAISPMHAFMVYDDSLLKRAMYFVTYSYGEDGEIRGRFSDSSSVTPFLEGEGGLEAGAPDEHYFHAVPAVEFVQNSSKRGVYEGVLSLIEAYNLALSDKTNDVEYFADAYMVVEGMELPDDYKTDLRENRLINLWGDGPLRVYFLDKPDADNTQENLLNRIEMLVFKMAMVPDITDEQFSTASGIALKIRLMPMSNLARKKEIKFKKAVRQRLHILANYPDEPFKGDDWQSVEVTMHRNMPEDQESEANVAGSLSGIVSEETQLSVLSCVDDPKKEMERKEREREAKAEAMSDGMPTNRTPVDSRSMYKITSILRQYRNKQMTRHNAIEMLKLIGLSEERAIQYLDDKDEEVEDA